MVHFLGDLLVITPQFVLAMWLLALVAAAATVRSLRRHRRGTAAACAVLSLLLVPAAAADAINSHYQYLPRVADLVNTPTWPTASATVLHTERRRATWPGGAVLSLRLAGVVSGFGTRTALAYLPPQYFSEPSRRFPVVYLIHGSPGAPVDWFRAARAAEAGLRIAKEGTPTILVAPRASRYWSDDSECVDRPRERVETYLTHDVPTDVDRQLRTIAAPASRGIVGNSSGGYCALDLGLRHRDVFGALASLSGFDHPTFTGGMARLFGRRADLSTVVVAHDPSRFAGRLRGRPVRVWLDAGRADGEPLRDLRRMRSLLDGSDNVVMTSVRPGGHTYGVWRPALRDALAWLARQLTPSGVPS